MTTKTNHSTEAQKILSMIENVDPNDTDALNEIDLAVCGYIYPFPGFYTETIKEIVSYGNISVQKKRDVSKLKYTRSRDALKAIRPEIIGLPYFSLQPMNMHDLEPIIVCYFDLHTFDNNVWMFKGSGQTEELAELHTIIQAIDYTRGKNDDKN